MPSYFRQVPDFDYVSRLSKAQNISDYIRVKNLFKRTKISEVIFNDLTFFTKYQIISDERPDNVAFKVYGDPKYFWIICLMNNIVNRFYDWPLPECVFQQYLKDKYSNPDGIHHYEVTQSSGTQTGDGPSDYSYKIEVNSDYPGAQSVSNTEYERRLQDKKVF